MDDRHAGKRLDLPVPGVDAWRESVERGEHGIATACDLALLTIACLSVAASLIAAVAGYALARRGLIKP